MWIVGFQRSDVKVRKKGKVTTRAVTFFCKNVG